MKIHRIVVRLGSPIISLCVLGLAAAAHTPAPARAEPDPGIPTEELVQVRIEDGARVSSADVLSALDRAVAVPELDIPDLGIRVYRTPGRAAVLPPGVSRLAGVRWASKVAAWQIPAGELTPTRSAHEPTAVQAAGDRDREPFFSLQWPMDALGDIRGAWDAATGGRILVGVIDTGIDCTHVDVRCTTAVNHYDAVRRIELYQMGVAPAVVHGTHVAGIIAGAHNGRGIIGVAPEAEILACRACSDGGRCSELDLMACVSYLAPRGVSVINMSLGGGFSPYTPGLCEALSWAQMQHGVLPVASVGNAGPSQQALYPATCGGVVGVAASEKPLGNTVAPYSQRASVDITAPGSEVLSSIPGGRWAYLSGTSMAAPHVSGAAALLAESLGDRWDPGTAFQLLTEYARKPPGSVYQPRLYGHGMLDVGASVRAVMPAQPTPSTPPGDATATPWWETPEGPTAEPTPTVEPTATHIPPVQTAIAELTERARPPSATPSEAPTASTTPSATGTPPPTRTATATVPPTASRTPTARPEPTRTISAIDLTVTALWPTPTPDVAGTMTAIAPTPDAIASAVWGTLRAPGAVATREAGRRRLFLPALLWVSPPEPTEEPKPTHPCESEAAAPWECPAATLAAVRTAEAAAWATEVAAMTATAEAPPPAPTRSWPLASAQRVDQRSGFLTLSFYHRWAPGELAWMRGPAGLDMPGPAPLPYPWPAFRHDAGPR